MGRASLQLARERDGVDRSHDERRSPDGLVPEGLIATLALFAAWATVLFLVTDAVVVAWRGHIEATESTLYVLAFAVVLPIAVVLAWVRVARPARGLELEPLAAGCLAVAGLGVLLQRVLNGDPLWESRVALAVTAGGMVGLWMLRGAAAERAGRLLEGRLLGGRLLGGSRAQGLMLGGAAIGLLSAAPGATFGLRLLGEAVLAALIVAGAYRLTSDLRLPRPAAWALDALFVLVLVLLLTNLDYGETNFIAHGEYYLGPVNDVLHGRTMLVDTVSQYGVGAIYFLAGIFEVLPLRVGTFMLVISALTAAQFAVVYLTLRAAWIPRGIAIITVAVTVLCTAGFALPTPNTSPLRFGPPYLLVALSVLATRSVRWRRAADGGVLAMVGLASLWSLDAFGFTAAAFLATELVRAAAAPGPWRRSAVGFLRRLGLAVATVLACQVALVLITLLASGHAPSWSWYLQLEAVFTTRGYGDLPIARWSPCFLLAGGYVISIAAVALILRGRRRVDPELLPGLVAIAGYAAFGAAMLSYFIGRSDLVVLWDVTPPGLVLIGLWLGVLCHQRIRLGRWALSGLVAVAGAAGLILFELRKPVEPIIRDYSLMSTLLGTGSSGVSIGDLRTLWQSPPMSVAEAEGDLLVQGYAASPRVPTVILLPSWYEGEVLLDSGRANALPFSYPAQDFLTGASISRIRRAALALRPGTVVIAPVAWWGAPKPPPIPVLRSEPVLRFDVFSPLEEIGEAWEVRLAILLREHYRWSVLGRSHAGQLVAIRLGGPRAG